MIMTGCAVNRSMITPPTNDPGAASNPMNDQCTAIATVRPFGFESSPASRNWQSTTAENRPPPTRLVRQRSAMAWESTKGPT